MDTTLCERLDILESSNQITSTIRSHVERFAAWFEQAYSVPLQEENAGAFVTHFAIASARLQRGEPITEVPDSIAELTSKYPDLRQLASGMFDGIAKDPTDAEVGFLTMYLCLLLGKE